MGSSAQNSSGVHWCRRRVRFNEVPEKVWQALVQSQVTFNRVPEKVPEKVWEALVQSQVRFNRVPEKIPEKVPEKAPEKVPGSLGAKPSQVQQGSEKVPEKVPEKVGEALVQSQPSWGVPAFGLAARFRKICKNETLRLLGIPPKLIAVANFPSRVLCWVSALCSIPWISLRALLWTISNGTKICMQVNLATRTVPKTGVLVSGTLTLL